MEEKKEFELELYAEEMMEIQSLSGFTTAASFGTVASAGSSASTAGTISSYGG
ncbi:thiocillin family RiPP [Bacillus atrophaeus]|uniref:thiocillin family RiPP n=1 Tax=Bacillus atrophaeus TaxID=1452 RepID=UPI003528C90F